MKQEKDFMGYADVVKKFGVTINDAMSSDATGNGWVEFEHKNEVYYIDIKMSNPKNEEADVIITMDSDKLSKEIFCKKYENFHLPNLSILILEVLNMILAIPADKENVTEDYVSFEVAKLLQELGFKTQCYAYFSSDGKPGHSTSSMNGDLPGNFHRPTLSIAAKWIEVNFCSFISVKCVTWLSEFVGVINDAVGERETEVYNESEVAYAVAIEQVLKNMKDETKMG